MNWPWLLFVAEIGSSTAFIVPAVVAFHLVTGGAWRESAEGRHMMAFSLAVAVALGYVTVRMLTVGPPSDGSWNLNVAIRAGAFLQLPIVCGWRLLLVLAAGRDRRNGVAA